LNLELILSFGHIWCRIEFHQLSNAWYVEINPKECFHQPALKEFLADILFSFNDAYPNESIVFVTEAEWFKGQFDYNRFAGELVLNE